MALFETEHRHKPYDWEFDITEDILLGLTPCTSQALVPEKTYLSDTPKEDGACNLTFFFLKVLRQGWMNTFYLFSSSELFTPRTLLP